MAEHSGKRFVRPAEVETQMFDWGTIKWLSEPTVTCAERFSAGIVLLEPGKGHAGHNHPGVEEILYVVSGQGKQMVDDGGETWQAIGPGDLVHIPPDVVHATFNTGWEPLKMVAIYSPPGPEAMLKTLPDCTVLPPGQLPGRS
jgi:oxalate decarboxylase/phosphoglucose isomerase-like protein (cupin superfamily)